MSFEIARVSRTLVGAVELNGHLVDSLQLFVVDAPWKLSHSVPSTSIFYYELSASVAVLSDLVL